MEKTSWYNGLSGLKKDNVIEIFEQNYWRWQILESDEVFIDGKKQSKSDIRLIAMGGFNMKPQPKRIDVSEEKRGYSLTRKLFAKKEISKLNRLKQAKLDFITLDRCDIMIDYCNKVLSAKDGVYKSFSDFLLVENKDAYVEKLKSVITKDKKGKFIAHVLIYLCNTQKIDVSFLENREKGKDRKSLYQFMKDVFCFDTSSQSINNYLVYNDKSGNILFSKIDNSLTLEISEKLKD